MDNTKKIVNLLLKEIEQGDFTNHPAPEIEDLRDLANKFVADLIEKLGFISED